MRVRVLADVCQGHGMCHLACPQLFELSNEDGHAVLIDEHVPPNLESLIPMVIESCPESAIQLIDETT